MRIGTNNHYKLLIISTVVILLQLTSCRPTRYVPEGEYLLQKNRVLIDDKTIDKNELEAYYRQKPNKRFLVLFKFHLSAYNYSVSGRRGKLRRWVGRVIGEEPVIFDSTLMERTREQFDKYMRNEAYYNAKVSYDVYFARKRAWVTYNIKTSDPLIIDSVYFQIDDTSLVEIVMADTVNSFLIPGERMTVRALESERKKIVTQLRDSGYFAFNKDYIRYIVDTADNKADIILELKKAIVRDSVNNIKEEPHKKYWINKVYFLPDFNPQKAIKQRDVYISTFDTVYYKGYGFIYTGEQNIKPKTILKANTVEQGDLFNYSKVNKTTENLNSLQLFRLNKLSFSSVKGNDSLINCSVHLTPSTYQNFSVNFETTNTQGNLGVGGNFNYKHKNLFHGAEIFNFKVSGSLQRQSETSNAGAFNIIEYGVETGLQTPSFILPFKMEKFYNKYKPKTDFSISYNYQQRPDYTRYIYNATMGYNWKGSRTIRHFLSPVDLSSVNVTNIDKNFLDSIQGTYLENSYKDYLIVGGNYSFIFSNKSKIPNRSYDYCRVNIGVAGNILYLFNNKFHTRDTVGGGYYQIFGLQYAQYALTDIDYRHYHIWNKDYSLVFRLFGGVAVPYGNAEAVPFIKQYFAGGAQGIRAWHPKDLGPGTYRVADSLNVYPNQTADIKLEFNMEYRYTMSGSWKGAIFLDVGNIWSISTTDERPGAVFEFNSFYKQFAVGTGTGIRYDMDFAVFRIDVGLKVRDPAIDGRDSWVLFTKPFNFNDDLVWHFAVGYPF